MTIEEHKEFAVESSSLKDVRSFAREVLAKDPIFRHHSPLFLCFFCMFGNNNKKKRCSV